MTAPTWDKAAPDYGATNVSDDLDATRDNSAVIFLCLALGIAPPESGWTYFYTGTLGAETTKGWTHSDGRKGRVTYTYASGFRTKSLYAWDRGLGAGYENAFAHNFTVDSNGYTTAATTSAS